MLPLLLACIKKLNCGNKACALLLLCGATGVLCGCGGGSGTPTTGGGITVTVTPSLAFAAPGGPEQFTAEVSNTSNTAVTWEVNGVAGGTAATGTISSTGLYTAPGAAGSATVTGVSQADSTKSGSASVTVLAPHPVAVRPTTSGIAEFYELATGNTFTPRGNNYIRLAWQQPPSQGSPQEYYHSTFNVGLYDSTRAEAALATMQTNGYNIVRVFLNGCCIGSIGSPNGPGLSTSYMANVADFLSRAANHGVSVIFTIDWIPNQGGYTLQNCDQFADYNGLNLCPSGVSTTMTFFQDFVQGLIDQGAHLEAIFAYELRNEYAYEPNSPPLSWTSGTVTVADGQTYDMSSPASRQEMMNNGLVYFTNQVRAAIIALDPTALVNVGFFPPQPGVIAVYPMIANSTADFADLHAYPSPSNLTLPQVVQDYGFVGYQQQKPVLMGEFGTDESDYPLISDASSVLQGWQVQSCAYSFTGWLLWTWDTDEAEQQSNSPFWYATAGDGSINAALSPAARPDPCQ